MKRQAAFIPLLSSCLMDPKIPVSISRLFRTNCVPSQMDAQRIFTLLAERNQELEIVGAEIERTRAELARLEDKKAGVRGVVQELEALMSPVRRMPTDIIAHIFEQCLRDEGLPTANPRKAPLLLGQVCKAWRELTFSLPCLWTTLRMEFPPTSSDWDTAMQSIIMTMHLWISRSKGLPISLFLDHPKGSPIPWSALVPLDQQILTLGTRFKELTLHFSPQALSSLLTFTQSSIPSLERLELESSNSLPSRENPPAVVLHSAPSLRSLSVSWGCLDLRDFQVPWSQLTELSLQYEASSFWNPAHSNYLTILAQCTNLKSCYLGLGALLDNMLFDLDLIEPVTLPCVETLKIRIYAQTPYLERFFDALDLPQLRSFEIQNASLALGSFTGQTECLPLLVRSAGTLENLSFIRIDIPDVAVVACLKQLPCLKSMQFLAGLLRLNHNLISALTLPPTSDQSQLVCPHLDTLHLRCSAGMAVEAIAALVESRCVSEPRLQRFHLQFATFEYGVDTRDAKIAMLKLRLQEYIDAGLYVELTKSGM
ncbi:hypothetical protein BV22DRAFT_466122 [Leucogyrophana mollusca]|uniref:Uncharacterized protein n=1 Tax=Leucogyrophana mollusca TaxID=85980 RepID=A0ACB8BKB7_9AGAM|nr:hypothetical protein BV22DRAFT_466122 [Leucogyrophana mollusca]